MDHIIWLHKVSQRIDYDGFSTEVCRYSDEYLRCFKDNLEVNRYQIPDLRAVARHVDRKSRWKRRRRRDEDGVCQRGYSVIRQVDV